MNVRREVGFWFLTALTAVLASLLIVLAATRLAFASAERADLDVPALHPRMADYAADDAPLQINALTQDLVADAASEDAQLRQVDDARTDLNLPAPAAPFSLGALLFASPTSIPTRLIRIPPTATRAPTSTSQATATASPLPGSTATAPLTVTGTATATSQRSATPLTLATPATAGASLATDVSLTGAPASPTLETSAAASNTPSP